MQRTTVNCQCWSRHCTCNNALCTCCELVCVHMLRLDIMSGCIFIIFIILNLEGGGKWELLLQWALTWGTYCTKMIGSRSCSNGMKIMLIAKDMCHVMTHFVPPFIGSMFIWYPKGSIQHVHLILTLIFFILLCAWDHIQSVYVLVPFTPFYFFYETKTII